MGIFTHPLAYIVYALCGFWFLFVWLPHRIHVIRIGRKYGWPREKHAAIIRLFREGELTSIGYIGADQKKQPYLQITGPWGQYAKVGVGGDLITFPGCDNLPEPIRLAFEGYIHHISDVPYLLCYAPFIEELQEKVPNISTSSIWSMANFCIYIKGCKYIEEVEPGSPEENTVLLISK